MREQGRGKTGESHGRRGRTTANPRSPQKGHPPSSVFGPALHEPLSWTYGAGAPLSRSPRLQCSESTLPTQVAALLARLWDLGTLLVRYGGASAPQAWASTPQRRALRVEGWDDPAEDSAGHWVGVTHDSTIRCLSLGNRPLAAPPDQYAAAGAVLASIPRFYAVWYAVLAAPGAPPLPQQHQYPCAGDDATARAWLAARKLVQACRERRRVQVVFHAP